MIVDVVINLIQFFYTSSYNVMIAFDHSGKCHNVDLAVVTLNIVSKYFVLCICKCTIEWIGV